MCQQYHRVSAVVPIAHRFGKVSSDQNLYKFVEDAAKAIDCDAVEGGGAAIGGDTYDIELCLPPASVEKFLSDMKVRDIECHDYGPIEDDEDDDIGL